MAISPAKQLFFRLLIVMHFAALVFAARIAFPLEGALASRGTVPESTYNQEAVRSATDACEDPLDGVVTCKTPVSTTHGRSVILDAQIDSELASFCDGWDLSGSGDSGWTLASDTAGQTWADVQHACGVTAEQCLTQFRRIAADCQLGDTPDYTITGGNIATDDYTFTIQRNEYAAPANSTKRAISNTTALQPCVSPYDGSVTCSLRTSPSTTSDHSASTGNTTASLKRRDYLSAISNFCAAQTTWPATQTSGQLDDGSTKLELRRTCSVTASQCTGQFDHILDTCGLDDVQPGYDNAGTIETADFTYDIVRYVVAEDE